MPPFGDAMTCRLPSSVTACACARAQVEDGDVISLFSMSAFADVS